MPCFNAERYVRAAVDSVLCQTWRELELIVVDDGSTDRSVEILSAIVDPRLRVLRQVNQGQCAACNRGYRDSAGELIKFFDADDVMDPEMIVRQVNRLGGRRDAIALGEWKRFYGSTPDAEPFSRLQMYRDAPPIDWLLHELASARPMMQCGLWLIPRPIIDARGLWDERLSLINDFEYFIRLLLGAKEILFTPGARLNYRSGLPNSLSGARGRKATESAFLALMLGVDHMIRFRDSDEVRAVCAAVLQDFDFTYYPEHPDLRARACARVAEFGGSTLEPDGPPGFHKARRIVGWRLARRLQRIAEALRLNHASRSARGPSPIR